MKMDNTPSIDKVNSEAVLKGLSVAAQLYKNTITTINKSGLSVTITAEPKIVEIQIDENLNKENLGIELKDLINEALTESNKKIIDIAIKELDNIK